MGWNDSHLHMFIANDIFYAPPDRESSLRTRDDAPEDCGGPWGYEELLQQVHGAYSQGETLDEISRNLQEVIVMLLEDGEPYNRNV